MREIEVNRNIRKGFMSSKTLTSHHYKHLQKLPKAHVDDMCVYEMSGSNCCVVRFVDKHSESPDLTSAWCCWMSADRTERGSLHPWAQRSCSPTSTASCWTRRSERGWSSTDTSVIDRVSTQTDRFYQQGGEGGQTTSGQVEGDITRGKGQEGSSSSNVITTQHWSAHAASSVTKQRMKGTAARKRSPWQQKQPMRSWVKNNIRTYIQCEHNTFRHDLWFIWGFLSI